MHHSRTRLAALGTCAASWLLVALVPVLLALYVGAIDQLNKLDPIPGLIAIFMAGFTSDQVKNLLTQKAKSAILSLSSRVQQTRAQQRRA